LQKQSSKAQAMSKETPVPPRLVELWLSVCHQALCRRIEGGLLAWLPEESGSFGNTSLAIYFAAEAPHSVIRSAERTFGKDYAIHGITHDLKKVSEAPLSLHRILAELQSGLLESQDLPEDALVLAFLLGEAGFRSANVPVLRVVYHLVPDDDGWLLKIQGEDDGEKFDRKEDALKAGAERARSHPSAELVVHLANGQFEECRSYGEPAKD
jgi:uncharacterized protein DUF2188